MVNAIINCHLATGRIGRPGMGPFGVTGQPNAMGGREVGGMANRLACHPELENPAHRDAVQSFWNAPAMAAKPGLKAVAMFRAVADKRIKALWIICTNPAASMPQADAVCAAIAGCDFTVVSEGSADTDTAKLAHVILPATTWGGKRRHCPKFRPHHQPPAAPAAHPRSGPARSGYSGRCRAPHGLGAGVHLPSPRKHFPRTCGPVRRRGRSGAGLRYFRPQHPDR